jgi:hypothetical protein
MDVLYSFFKSRSIPEVKAFVKWLFPNVKPAQFITDRQVYIVKRIAFSEVKRLSISAFTRYGKSQMVAIGIAIYILINRNKKIKFIGPTDDQAQVIKNYMSELILNSRGDILLNLSELEIKEKRERLKAEASQKRMTFRNGCEYKVITAHGKGFGAMSHGADLVVIDESAMISRESYAKIVRMLGDDPENSSLIELFNPWDKDTKAYDHSVSPRFERIQIDYKIGLEEGRITQDFVDEMREDMTPLEFKVLYESDFPDEAEDSIFRLSDINKAETLDFGFLEKIEQGEKGFEFVVSCDPADKGLDWTVITWGITKNKQYYEVLGVWSEPKSDLMDVVGKMLKKAEEITIKGYKCGIYFDAIGLGVGVNSRLKELKKEMNLDFVELTSCHFGQGSVNKDEFRNKKAENYFRLQDLFREEMVSLKKVKGFQDYHYLKTELLKMKWELTSSMKKMVVDPDKSPDFADALVFLTWKPDVLGVVSGKGVL